LELKMNRYKLVLMGVITVLFLSSCSLLNQSKRASKNVSLGNITGNYQSGVSEGEVKKVILYFKESVVLKDNEELSFTLEKKPDEYRVVLDLKETDKFDLSESFVALLMDLFGSSEKKETLTDEQLLSGLFRGLAIGLTEDVLNEYTEIRVEDREQKRYRIYPPSFE